MHLNSRLDIPLLQKSCELLRDMFEFWDSVFERGNIKQLPEL